MDITPPPDDRQPPVDEPTAPRLPSDHDSAAVYDTAHQRFVSGVMPHGDAVALARKVKHHRARKVKRSQ